MQDHFLHYMLRKVLGVHITTLPHGLDKERLFDFLPYLFPNLLNSALRQP